MELHAVSKVTLKKLYPYSSVIFRPIDEKAQIKIPGYKLSDKFVINTYGISGILKL